MLTFFDEYLLDALAAPAQGVRRQIGFADTRARVSRREAGRFVPSEPQSW